MDILSLLLLRCCFDFCFYISLLFSRYLFNLSFSASLLFSLYNLYCSLLHFIQGVFNLPFVLRAKFSIGNSFPWHNIQLHIFNSNFSSIFIIIERLLFISFEKCKILKNNILNTQSLNFNITQNVKISHQYNIRTC